MKKKSPNKPPSALVVQGAAAAAGPGPGPGPGPLAAMAVFVGSQYTHNGSA